jgi:hypothetical protein
VSDFLEFVSGLRPIGPGRYRSFRRGGNRIMFRRSRQSTSDVAALAKKYEKPVFGFIRVIELLEKMQDVSDPTDPRLYGQNQLTHTLQALESMEDKGCVDEDMRLAMVLHDLGKLLYIADEPPENVFGMKSPIGEDAEGIGLDKVNFQWNHDDFVYSRFKDLVPDHVAWLLRFHSLYLWQSEKYMNAKDKDYAERYLREFQFHDQESKSRSKMPRKGLEFYRDWIDSVFPQPIMF